MADKIQRQTQKIFAENAATDSLAVFGSMATGNPIYTDNIEDLQSNAYQEGWASATAANEAPFMEEMNGVQYGLSKQIAYTLQTGMPEWDAGTEYFANTSFCQVDGVWYQSLTDHNIGNNPTEDTTNWKKVDFSGIEPSPGTSLPLFSPVLQDHILSFEESKGYALQGTYVYKESAPERYGYPDFYNKCLEEYKNSTLLEQPAWTQPVATGNTTKINGGNMVITSSRTVNDDWAGYKAFIGVSSSNNNGWATDNHSTAGWWQVKFPYKIKITGLKYYRRYTSNPDNATTGRFYTSSAKTVALGDEFSVPVGASSQYSLNIANIPAEGIITDTIYLETKLISGSYGGMGYLEVTAEEVNLVGLLKNANGHMYYDISNKESIDDYFNKNGAAWFYGIDEENERVFLPRNNYFMQCTSDSNKVGDLVEAGLPNITGIFHSTQNIANDFNGAFTSQNLDNGSSTYGASGTHTREVNFNASLSNPIYGKSKTVQPTSVNQLLYIVVGNTEETQAITNVTEITTSENDTIPLFTGMYFDFKPNNPSWLKAGEQVNSGGVYTSCYNTLVNCLTEADNIYNLKVIEESAMKAGVDYSEYWKVNQDEMYFVTPTKLSYKALNGGVKGNGNSLGLTNGTQSGSLTGTTAPSSPCFVSGNYSTVGSSGTQSYFSNNATIGVQTDSAKSGIIAEESASQLYFKVANAVQNLELLDAGEILEALTDKISKQECKAYITDTYRNGSSWCRVWSDNWCEQGGYLRGTVGGSFSHTITFIKPYANQSYTALATIYSVQDADCGELGINTKTQTTLTITAQDLNTNASNKGVSWYTCGFIA